MRAIKRLLEWILIGSSGGLNRVRILEKIFEKPHNANQLSNILSLDYKTIRHHLEILEKNHIIISVGKGYGKVYYPSNILEENIRLYKEIINKIGKK